MAIIIFPPNPNQGDTFTADNGVVYTYDGVKWEGATGNLLNVTTDVIPSVDATYNLGNSTNQWQDVWVSGNVEASYFLGNGAYLTGISGGANTGQITFNNTTISGPSYYDQNAPDVILQAGSRATATGNVVAASLYLKPGHTFGPPGNVVVGYYNLWNFNDSTGNLIMPSNTSSINYANGQPYGGTGGGATDWANIGNISGPNGPQDIIIGYNAGANSSGQQSVAIGYAAGQTNQGVGAVAIGAGTAELGQGNAAVAIGPNAGEFNQGVNAVAIGLLAGTSAQGNNAVAIGTATGGHGDNSIAIGSRAGSGSSVGGQANNTIILNATGNYVTGVEAQTDSFYVAPVRNDTGNVTNALYYNTATHEISYGPAGGGSTGNFVFSGDNMLMPTIAKLNSGGIGNTNAAEFGTEVYSNGTAIYSSQIYMGAGTTEIRGIVDAAGAGLMYAGVEGAGFAGIVGMDPGVTSQYAIAVGPGNTILLGATTGNGNLTTTEYTAGVGAINGNGTLNGLLASSSNVVISNGNTAGWSFGSDGNLTLPGSIHGSGYISINPDPANSNLAWTFADFVANVAVFAAPISDNANIGLLWLPGSNGLATVSWAGNSDLTPLANTLLLNSSNAVTIATNGLSNTFAGNTQWLFDTAGNLTLPAGGIISDTGNDGIGLTAAAPPVSITLSGADHAPCNGTYTQVVGYQQSGLPTWFKSGDHTSQQYIVYNSGSNQWQAVTTDINTNPIYINTGSEYLPLAQWAGGYSGGPYPTGTYTYSNPAWTFGADGNLTLPGNTSSINYANGQPYGGSGSGYSNAAVATFLADYGSNTISSTGSITAGSITQAGIGNINGYNGYFANNLTAQGTVQATSFVSPTGNGTFYGNATTGLDALYAGLPTFTVLGTDVIAQFSANVDSYSQINLQNLNTGNLASADYIITADIGNNSSYYLDLGLASSTHNDPYFFGDVGFANDGYLTVVGPDYAGPSTANGPGNLVLGSSNGLIKMFVGNASQANVIATVSSSGLNVLGNITTAGDSGNITGANIISANTLTALSITQTGTGNINGYNGYFANNVTVQGTLQATGLIVPQGNGTFFGNSVSGNSALFAGVPGYTVLGSNVVVQFAGNANSYSQVNFQNIDTGSAATTDYIATADTGTDSTYYLDMGIAGSTYDNTNPNVSLGTSLFPLDSYVISAGSTNITPGGNLVVGTITPERVISFIAGGVNDTSIVQVIANTGISVYRSISSTGNIIAGNISTLETGGNITGNTVTAATAVVTTPTTVDNLPSAVTAGPGARSFVVDSNTITFYSNVGNAGSNSVPVFSDGISWRVG
jgi:hypothetical protein